MRIFIIKKTTLLLILGVVLIVLFYGSYYSHYQAVYKDREYWEKTGAIIWEVNVPGQEVALTFDDGPSPTFTSQVLDLLAQYNAKATFFVIGNQAEKYPEIIRQEFLQGHEIANHTYNHQEVNRLSEYELKKDLQQAHQIIYQLTGLQMELFRPTSGYYDRKIVNAARTLNYKVIIWTWGQDSRDWTDADGQEMAERIISTVKPGNIILFHDRGGDRSNTIKCLQIILPVLQEKGFHFVSVSTLLRLVNENQQKHHPVNSQ